jgi:uncharacterized protein (TIGR02246 family)
MGRQDLGRVAPGAMADLLLLDADPAESSSALSRIATVIRGGRLLDPATLAPDGPAELAQRQLNGYNARDLEAFLAPYAEDVQVLGLDGKVQLAGKAALRRRYRAVFDESPRLHARLVKRIAVGPFVVDEEEVTGLAPEAVRAAAIYEVRAGRIATVRFLR